MTELESTAGIIDDSRFVSHARSSSISILVLSLLMMQVAFSLYYERYYIKNSRYVEALINLNSVNNSIRSEFDSGGVYIDYLERGVKLESLPNDSCAATFHYNAIKCVGGSNFVEYPNLTLVKFTKCPINLPQFALDTNGDVLIPSTRVEEFPEIDEIKNVPTTSCVVENRFDIVQIPESRWAIYRKSTLIEILTKSASKRFGRTYAPNEVSSAIRDLTKKEEVSIEILGVKIKSDVLSLIAPIILSVLSISFMNKVKNINLLHINKEEPWIFIGPSALIERILCYFIVITLFLTPIISEFIILSYADSSNFRIIGTILNAVSLICLSKASGRLLDLMHT